MIVDIHAGTIALRGSLAALAMASGVLVSAAPLAAQGTARATSRATPPAARTGAPPIDMVRVPSGIGGLRIALHHLAPRHPRPAVNGSVVLLIHGASFPTLLADGYRFRGRSWMDDLAEAGYDVWGLDFLGYGASDRYPQMNQPAGANPPPGRAAEGARQIDAAVRYITARTHVARLSLIAHSAGTLATGLYAGEHPSASRASCSSARSPRATRRPTRPRSRPTSS